MVLCKCGCGGETKTVIIIRKRSGIVKEIHNVFIHGHTWKNDHTHIGYKKGNKFGVKFQIGHKINNGKRRSPNTEFKKGEHISPNTEYKKGNAPIMPIKDTKIEVKIQNYLKELGIEFLTHQYMNINHGYKCDILIPILNMVIECDGVYWHKYPVGTERDHIRTKELIEKGFKVLRLWEYDINRMNLKEFKNRIEGV